MNSISQKIKLVILLWIYISPLHFFGQPSVYHPFPSETALWETSFSSTQGCLPCELGSSLIWMDGSDTVIGNFTYNKIFSECNHKIYENAVYVHQYFSYHNYAGALREDSAKRVYYLHSDSVNEELLYDFNLSVGDTYPRTGQNDCLANAYVSVIDSILINGKYRKRWKIDSCESVAELYIIEGIGSSTGLFGTFVNFEAGYSLICFIEHDTAKIYGKLFAPYMANCCDGYFTVSDKNSDISPARNIFPVKYQDQTKVIFGDTAPHPYSFNVIDVSGKTVEPHITLTSNLLTFDFNQIPKGVYLINIKGINFRSVYKFIRL